MCAGAQHRHHDEDSDYDDDDDDDALPSLEDVCPPLGPPLTRILSVFRLGKCWEPRRLRTRTSRLPSCPSRGESIRLRPESPSQSRITPGFGSSGSCYGRMAPYVCLRRPKHGGKREEALNDFYQKKKKKKLEEDVRTAACPEDNAAAAGTPPGPEQILFWCFQ